MKFDAKLRPCFWFGKDAREAAEFYVSLLPDSRIERVLQTHDGDPPVIELTLAGTPVMMFEAPPMCQPNEAASIAVLTEDQGETDALWAALTADGGAESMCGWLKDRYGVSWQITPKRLVELLNHDDAETASRARAAMMRMNKIDIAALERASIQ